MKTKNVLIIDSAKPRMARFLQKFLKFDGHKTDLAATFQTATNKIAKKHYNLVILEWCLDKNKTGFNVLPLLPKKTKVILFSNENPLFLEKMMEEHTQIVDYFAKYHVFSELLPKVKEVLGN